MGLNVMDNVAKSADEDKNLEAWRVQGCPVA